MKRLLLLMVLFFSSPTFAQDDVDLAELIGIPVPDGLTEDADQRLVFDKVEGRIIHARFGGSITSDEVLSFFEETLIQLGWVLDVPDNGPNRAIFTRENERLAITITSSNPLEVTLDLGPSGEVS